MLGRLFEIIGNRFRIISGWDYTAYRVNFLIIYVTTLILNLAIGLILRFRSSPFQLEADEREYYDIARNIISGTYQLTSRRSLGFPVIEAGIISLTGNFLVLQVMIVAFYSLAAPLLFLLVRKLSDDVRCAWVSVLIFMLWPPALYYGISLYSESVALPLLLLSLVLLPVGSAIRPAGPHTLLLCFTAGACLGVTTHVRPMYLLFLPVVLVIMLIEDAFSIVTLRRFAVVLAGFALFILPWSVLMTTRYHHLIVVTSNGGETLAGGLNPQLLRMAHSQQIQLGDRSTWVGPGKWLPMEATGYLRKADESLTYDQTDALLKSRAISWAENHPAEAAYLEFCKLRYLWGFSSFADSEVYLTLFGALPTIILLSGSILLWAGSPTFRRRYPRLWLLPLFVSGVALISWGSWRFRQVGDVGLIGLFAIGVFLLADRRHASGSPTLRPPG